MTIDTPRKIRPAVVTFGIALALTLGSTRVLSQGPGFQITGPPDGSVFSPGQVVTFQWTGGDPSWLVLFYIIDSAANQVVDAVSVNGDCFFPNSGTASWTVPSTIGAGSTCGRTYRTYVQNLQGTSWAYGVQFTVICQIPVAIDIKPGLWPNSINRGNRGTIPVAILSSPTIAARTAVDLTSLTFGRTGNEQSLKFLNAGGEDVNGDGFPDLVCHFATQETAFQPGDTTGVLKGVVLGGTPIIGTDTVRIVY